MDVLWEILNGALLLFVVFLVVLGVRAWLRPVTTSGIATVVAVVAFFVLGWTQGNKTGGFGLTEPVNWPLQIRLLSDYPGIGEGACYDYIEPGLYVSPGAPGDESVETEVTPEEARRQNAEVRACEARARRENRDYTKDWANWMSVLLIATAAIAGYDHWGRRK